MPWQIADLADHLQIEHGALVKALRLDHFALLVEFAVPPAELIFYASAARCSRVSSRHHVMRLGINRQAQIGLLHLAQQRIDLLQAFDFIAP